MNYNKAILGGNLTGDPELKEFSTGSLCCKFSIAINKTFVNKQGDKETSVFFMPVRAYGKMASNIVKFFRKGQQIFIEGELRKDEWKDEKGEQKRMFYIAAERFEFIGSKGETKAVADEQGDSSEYPY